jgi:hypothetical protein
MLHLKPSAPDRLAATVANSLVIAADETGRVASVHHPAARPVATPNTAIPPLSWPPASRIGDPDRFRRTLREAPVRSAVRRRRVGAPRGSAGRSGDCGRCPHG